MFGDRAVFYYVTQLCIFLWAGVRYLASVNIYVVRLLVRRYRTAMKGDNRRSRNLETQGSYFEAIILNVSLVPTPIYLLRVTVDISRLLVPVA